MKNLNPSYPHYCKSPSNPFIERNDKPCKREEPLLFVLIRQDLTPKSVTFGQEILTILKDGKPSSTGDAHYWGKSPTEKYEYIGKIVEGRKEGEGIMKFSNGDICSGNWKNDCQDGHCKYMWENGDAYTGNFKNGKRDGYGIYRYSTGESYKGYYKAGKRHGMGIYTNEWGETSKRTYLNGKWVGGIPELEESSVHQL